jgi:hypothetical protein
LATIPTTDNDTIKSVVELITAFIVLFTVMIPASREQFSNAANTEVTQKMARGAYSRLMLFTSGILLAGSALSLLWKYDIALGLLAGSFIGYSTAFKFNQRPIQRGEIANLVGLAVLLCIGTVLYALWLVATVVRP